MGVMECSRRGCNHIMCDTYIDSIGYLCFDCQKEFKKYLTDQNLNPVTGNEIFEELKNFQKIQKSEYDYEKEEEITVDEFFSKHTKN